MAQVTTGTVKTNTLFYSTFYLKWTRTSYSIANNTSTISWEAGLITTNGVYWLSNAVKITSIYINGTKVLGSKTYSNIKTNGTHKLASGSLTINHNTDGSKSFNVYVNGWLYDTGSPTGSGTFTLPTIPRASSVSGGSGNIGSATTINITRASSLFTHTLEYAFGSLTGTIATGVATSYNWTIPTSFYAQIPNSNSGTGSITCKTYNGSTLIGTKTISFTAKVTNSNPTVGAITYKDSNSVTTAITGNDQRIIRNNSNLLFTIGTATAKNSATISKYQVILNSVTKTKTSAGDLDFGTINLSSNATATLKVTDSRGNTATKDITIVIDDWELPSAIITLNRKNNFYSETYLKADASYSSLNNKNVIGIQYQCKKVNDKDFSVTGNLTDNVQSTLELDNNYQWYIQVIVTDLIGQTIYDMYLDRGMPIIFFDRIKNSVGVNCFPTQTEQLEVNGNMVASTKSFNSISSLDNTGEGQDLHRSGLYTACLSDVWYHLINVRHRNGISDGVNYGLQIRSRITAGYKLEYRKQNAGTWSVWRTIAEEGVTLYENANGTTGTITLSESVANFNYLEIFYMNNLKADVQSIRVPNPNNKIVTCSCVEPSEENEIMYIRATRYTLVGTAMTYVRGMLVCLQNNYATTIQKLPLIHVIKVVGYR